MNVYIVAFFLIALIFACVTAEAAAIDETKVRCKVCDRAIAHIWQQGVDLRKHCKLHNTDPRCHHTNFHKSAIEEIINDVCDDVVHVNTATYNSENGAFTMAAIEETDRSNNDEALNTVISKSCKKWVLEKNTVATLTRFVFANLEAGKPTQSILNPLQTKFCYHACQPPVAEGDNDEL